MRKTVLLLLVFVSLALAQGEPAADYKRQIEELDDRIDELENARSSYSWLIPVILSIAGLLIVLVGLFGVINQRRFDNTLKEAKEAADEAIEAAEKALSYKRLLEISLSNKVQDWEMKPFNNINEYLYSDDNSGYMKQLFIAISIQADTLLGLGGVPDDKVLLFVCIHYYLERLYNECLRFISLIKDKSLYSDYYLLLENIYEQLGMDIMQINAINNNKSLDMSDKASKLMKVYFRINDDKQVKMLCKSVVDNKAKYKERARKVACIYEIYYTMQEYYNGIEFDYNSMARDAEGLVELIDRLRADLEIETFYLPKVPFKKIFDFEQLSEYAPQLRERFWHED